MNAQTKWIPHPGVLIAEELETRGWSQRDLAYIMNVGPDVIYMLLSGKRGISPEMAKSLGAAFRVDPAFFLNMQRSYELAMTQDPDSGIAVRSRLQGAYPVRDMIKRGWLEDSHDSSVLEDSFRRFFKVKSLEEVPRLDHAAKKTSYDETPPSQIAWLFRVKQMAAALPSVRYSEKSLRQSLSDLRQLLVDPQEARHVPRILQEVGVRFVVVEPLPGSKIDGVCFWLDGHSPVIGVSLRFDRIDNFWFVLRHEIEHVLRKHGRIREAIDAELEGGRTMWDGSLPPEEQDANLAASDFVVPQDKLDNFMVRMRPTYSENRIVLFARSLGIHPGLVVGQLQNRKAISYANFRKHLVAIRSVVVSTALTDGWGNASMIYQ
jgi:HTH-type transcriptional regulator/antitoxin HigA